MILISYRNSTIKSSKYNKYVNLKWNYIKTKMITMIFSPFKEYHVVSGHVPSVHHFFHFVGEVSPWNTSFRIHTWLLEIDWISLLSCWLTSCRNISQHNWCVGSCVLLNRYIKTKWSVVFLENPWFFLKDSWFWHENR